METYDLVRLHLRCRELKNQRSDAVTDPGRRRWNVRPAPEPPEGPEWFQQLTARQSESELMRSGVGETAKP